MLGATQTVGLPAGAAMAAEPSEIAATIENTVLLLVFT
jgi:hypothetical protein